MKIFDCFTFFNELDLLELRLKLLDPYVDHFVIAEANLTHAGHSKPYIYMENKERFSVWADKIIYIPVALSTDGLTFNENEKNYNPQNGSWKLEHNQRKAFSQVNDRVRDEDMIMISDLDEIPDPAILEKINTDSPRSLSQLFHNYFLNCQNLKGDRWWNGTVVCSGKFFKEKGAQHLRDNRNAYPKIKKAGWHFSYLGGIKAIQKKLGSFGHTEYNKPEFLDEAHIIRCLEKGQDVLKRDNIKYRFVPLAKYPKRLRSLMLQYPSFIKELSWDKRLLNFFR